MLATVSSDTPESFQHTWAEVGDGLDMYRATNGEHIGTYLSTDKSLLVYL